jgi:spermidine synthase
VEAASQSLSSLVFLLVTISVSIFLVYRLLDRIRTVRGASGRLDVAIDELGGFGYSRLVWASILSLFLEMMMIRWVSSEIRIFAYFKNFVLVACFLGFGLGCYLCRRRVQLMALIAPLLLLTLVLKAPISPLRRTISALPQMLGAGAEVHVWGVPAMPASWTAMLLAIAFIVPLFAVVAISFVPVGQMVGWYLENSPKGVTAYSVNVLGSLAGIAAFTILSFLAQPPWVWFFVAGVLSTLVFWRNVKMRKALALTFLICIGLLAIPDHRHAMTYWSPYQKLTIRPVYDHGELESYSLTTNDSLYQTILNLSSAFVRAHEDAFRQHPVEQNSYNMPYRFYPAPPSVLVLGSGMGNDVAAAVRNGAERVQAVEIDPLILKLGKELHFEHPYQSPRVHVALDDARSYIENSRDQFDLIVFSLLDSHTTASHFTNIRIDNFVYTREAFAKAKRLLKPDGIFVVKFQVDNPWIAGRLYELMRTTFDQNPIQFQTDLGGFDSSGRFFVSGSAARLQKATSEPSLAAYLTSHSNIAIERAAPTTDDWPYFYQHAPGLPISVILVSIAVLIVFGWFLRQTSGEGGKLDFHFFFLGAGFMLLEAQIVSKMALLFGTTWVVNAVVVSGLLCLIVASNLLYTVLPRVPLILPYVGLFISLGIMFVIPLEKLFYKSWILRACIATLVLCAPVFFAGLIFISSFARAGFKGSALGSNLFGSLLGGLLESASLWFGLKSLTILAAGLYVCSVIFLRSRARESDASAIDVSSLSEVGEH